MRHSGRPSWLLIQSTERPVSTLDELEATSRVRPQGYGSRSLWRRFRRDRPAVVGLVVLVLFATLAIAAPLITSYDPLKTDLRAARSAPSGQHFLGTDTLGRDVWSRLLYGGRISLVVGLAAALTSTILGLVLGAVAGFYRGTVDSAITRLTELTLSFPSLLAVIILSVYLGAGLVTLVLVISLFEWPTASRVVRGLVFSLRSRDYVLAVRGLGGTESRILRRHIVPFVMAPLIVCATFTIANAILAEAALSYLGFGIPIPTPSSGNMLTDASSLNVLRDMPWIWVPPGAAVAITVLSVNLVGGALRDALDPRERSLLGSGKG